MFCVDFVEVCRTSRRFYTGNKQTMRQEHLTIERNQLVPLVKTLLRFSSQNTAKDIKMGQFALSKYQLNFIKEALGPFEWELVKIQIFMRYTDKMPSWCWQCCKMGCKKMLNTCQKRATIWSMGAGIIYKDLKGVHTLKSGHRPAGCVEHKSSTDPVPKTRVEWEDVLCPK